jgi:hypothetical protein
MKKGLIIAAALSAMALSTAGASTAAPALGQLGGVKAAVGGTQLEQVHYRKYRHSHNRRWNKNRGWKHRRYGKRRHCFLRVGRRVCVLR